MPNYIIEELQEIRVKLITELDHFKALRVESAEVTTPQEYNNWAFQTYKQLHNGYWMLEKYLYTSYYDNEEGMLKFIKHKINKLFSRARGYDYHYCHDLEWIHQDINFNHKISGLTAEINQSIKIAIQQYEKVIEYVDKKLSKYSDYDDKDLKIESLGNRVSDLESDVKTLKKAIEKAGIEI